MSEKFHRASVSGAFDLSIKVNPETRALAARLVWFESAEMALAQPLRFLAYAFANGRDCDMRIVRSHLSDDALRYALQNAPPGIIDAKSWAYWHVMLAMGDAPALPERQLPDRV
jgi:hypothetical protein